MKTLLQNPLRSVFALTMMAAMVATVRADETKEQKIPPGQLKKYDLNKDGVLDESEKAAWLAGKKGLAEKQGKQTEEEVKKADKEVKKTEEDVKKAEKELPKKEDVKKAEKEIPKTEEAKKAEAEAKKAKTEAKKAAAEAKRLEKFDANKDGKLDETELAAEAEAKAKKKKSE